MKQTTIHYLGHASYSILYNNWHLLLDPCFYEPFEHGNTFFNPPRELNTTKMPIANAIYISHSHKDHFDEKTLRYLLNTAGKDLPVFCPNDSDILNPLRSWGFSNIKTLKVEETACIGPYTLFTTPSPLSPFNEMGIVVTTSDIILWNQVDTAIDLYTIWKIKNKLNKQIDILFCPFLPLQEHALAWVDETSFPKKRMENLITKALAVDAKYVIPSSASIKGGNYFSWSNSRLYPTSKPQFIKRLKKQFPLVNAVDIEAGNKLSLQNKELVIESSHFVKQTGKRIHFCEQPHPKPPAFNLEVLSSKDWEKIIFHLKKIPLWLSWYMKQKFVYYLECIKANNYFLVIEIKSKNKDLTFLLYDRLQKIKEVTSPKIWDYWFQYNGTLLLKKIHDPNIFVFYYAFRNTVNNPNRKKPESVLSLLGYNEEHLVDGAESFHEDVSLFWNWPFTFKDL